jgi:hypothetical protein
VFRSGIAELPRLPVLNALFIRDHLWIAALNRLGISDNTAILARTSSLRFVSCVASVVIVEG